MELTGAAWIKKEYEGISYEILIVRDKTTEILARKEGYGDLHFIYGITEKETDKILEIVWNNMERIAESCRGDV